jgi:molybdopterin molybdotransferase
MVAVNSRSIPAAVDEAVPSEQSESRSVDQHAKAVAALLAPTPVRRRPLARCRGLALAEPLENGTHPVLDAGTVLSAGQLALVAALGHAELAVHAPARVAVLSAGSELVLPGGSLRPGQIYESNGVLLAAAVRAAGAEAETLRLVPDDVDQLNAALPERLADVDLLLTSGGVSAGAYEVVKDAMAADGVDFLHVAMRPGGPQGLGCYRGVPVTALPGNPVGAWVSFEVFVRPALRAAMKLPARRERRRLRLTEPMGSRHGKRQYRVGKADLEAGAVAPVGGPGSHLVSGLAMADCLIEIAEDTESLPAGAEVSVLLTG